MFAFFKFYQIKPFKNKFFYVLCYMRNAYVEILAMGIVCVFVIVAYGTFRCKMATGSYKDPLTIVFAPPPFDKFLDGWGISHFLFFALLGYMYPTRNTLIFIFLLGVLWEIIESLAKDHPFYLSKCNYTITTDDGAGWWYGRWQDIVMNTCGMFLGYALAKHFK